MCPEGKNHEMISRSQAVKNYLSTHSSSKKTSVYDAIYFGPNIEIEGIGKLLLKVLGHYDLWKNLTL